MKWLFLLCAISFPLEAYAGWIVVPPTRTDVPDYGPVVTDVESHLPAKHPYRDNDKITWTHEGTHGINSHLRGVYQQPSFYCLEDTAFILKEPSTTLEVVAKAIPENLRGGAYELYCVTQQHYWNENPSSLFDEWVAYINGSTARKELNITGRGETVDYMLELAIYSTYAVKCSGDDDEDLKLFLRVMWTRTLDLYGDSNSVFEKFDDNLQAWLKNYLGNDWVLRTFTNSYIIW